MRWEAWVALGAACVAVAALVLGVVLYRRQQEIRRRFGLARLGTSGSDLALAQAPAGGPRGPLVALVANPSKPDVAALKDDVLAAVAERGLPEPLWLETTVDDPGVGQAREAVERGAAVVVAIGGDGTVRAVAEGLVGTGVPMGLLPVGTGNLLARNLDLPLGNPLVALRIALTGIDRPIDVGWVRILEADPPPDPDTSDPIPPVHPPGTAPSSGDGREHLFLVIAGLGFDAAMVADTDDGLKARVGWIAYFVSGVRHLNGRRLRAQVRLDRSAVTSVRLRSLLIGNCGRLPGGITLLPDAVLDDGWLDIAAIDTRGGIAGWAQLFGEVVLQGVGVRTDLPAKIGRIDHARAQTLHVRVSTGAHVQVDGDVIGRARALSARVQAGGLVVRVPSTGG